MSAGNHDPDLLAAVEEVDALPRPSRHALSLDAIVSMCALAAKTAMRADVEKHRLIFGRTVRGMEPASVTPRSIDGWARLGAVQGAIDRWTDAADAVGRSRGAPSQHHQAAFVAAYGLAWQITHIELERANGGRRG